uniref:NADH-ubiquinone oxidoreductase chain 4 n=1 Tax=Orchesella villosa TaxID=48706 RepID=B2BSD3_ORCVL|nr:NADH dehydrogenase subunit 4 [Orchesella villosa]ABS57586.1 NADH dehydrogenase subunit 4 [Orchesella villosa]
MMKFIFCLFFSWFSMCVMIEGVWLINLVYIFLLFILVFKNFFFSSNFLLNIDLGMDMASYSLIILSFWITVLMYYSSENIFKNKNAVLYFGLCLSGLMFSLLLSFSSINLLSFYFFFEASLIPTLLIILGWGYQPERLQAGIYFLFYTLFASLPLLLCLIFIYLNFGSLDFLIFINMNSLSLFLFLSLSLAFLVKMPMFYSHLWLPKAHVEAPVSGSMILAGVLLKLGGYGLFRVLGLGLVSFIEYSSYLFGVSILGMFYVGLMCCRLNDLKALVAYSSVAHMALVICGIFSIYFWGMSGALMMMVAHGLASSGLFCVVNMYYERIGSRSLYLIKGFILLFPLFSLFFFCLCAANIAAPPTINLLSEIFLMVSILKYNNLMLFIFPVASYLGAVFTLFMFSYSQHGKINFGGYSVYNVNFREYLLLFLHLLPVNLMIVKIDYFLLLY